MPGYINRFCNTQMFHRNFNYAIEMYTGDKQCHFLGKQSKDNDETQGILK